MTTFAGGFADELEKLALSPLITFPALNTAQYIAALRVPGIRKLLGRIGNRVMGTGFVHAMQGKRVSRWGVVGLGSGVLTGPALMSLYETGWGMGNTVARKIESLPAGHIIKPLEALYAADVAAQAGFKHAPAIGATAGAAMGLSRERIRSKRKKEKMKPGDAILSALEGGIKGGLVGAGVRVFGPRLPGPSQLHKLREEHLERVLGGKDLSKTERVLNWGARPMKHGERAEGGVSLL